jgi:hypothetical protein
LRGSPRRPRWQPCLRTGIPPRRHAGEVPVSRVEHDSLRQICCSAIDGQNKCSSILRRVACLSASRALSSICFALSIERRARRLRPTQEQGSTADLECSHWPLRGEAPTSGSLTRGSRSAEGVFCSTSSAAAVPRHDARINAHRQTSADLRELSLQVLTISLVPWCYATRVLKNLERPRASCPRALPTWSGTSNAKRVRVS